eukprot:CAMPEP_0169220538 /NCGR_PEP_ID=MMETSP1016-20121227/20574_1 /TAXON_ID=342587 /ORGANISM="Karlodinium micrum, Strain CCMP2283" /LENGTH=151 /DNA_ID=CAMNT_0009298697 /DNA_START=75 /DNA_END=530 /DNA_ORIENTATION=+
MEPDTNVFIMGLPYGIDDETLNTIFGPYGTITWSKVMPSNGKPNMAAIVEFADISEAKWVVENLSGNMPEGLTEPITCSFKRQSKGYGKGKDGKGKGNDFGGFGKSKGKWGGDDGGKSFGKWGGDASKGKWGGDGGKAASPYGGGKGKAKW